MNDEHHDGENDDDHNQFGNRWCPTQRRRCCSKTAAAAASAAVQLLLLRAAVGHRPCQRSHGKNCAPRRGTAEAAQLAVCAVRTDFGAGADGAGSTKVAAATEAAVEAAS